jgi:hypothetical protein
MGAIQLNIGGVSVEVDSEVVSKGIEAGKIEVAADNIVVYPKEQFEAFKNTLATDEYKKGKVAGVEMSIKEAREKHGLTFEGKTIDNLLEAMQAKAIADAKVEPNTKIQALEADLKKIQTNYLTLETEHNSFKQAVEGEKVRFKKDNTILSKIDPSKLIVSPDIAILALKNKGFDIDSAEDGSFVPVLNGAVLKDQRTLQPLSIDTVINDTLASLNLFKQATGGAGGKDEPGGAGATSYEAFAKRMADNNIQSGSMEFNEKMNAEIKAGTLKI